VLEARMSEQTPRCRFERRRRSRIGYADASGLWPDIQMGSGMQQSYTPLHLYSPILRPCLRKQKPLRCAACSLRATSVCCDVVGLRGIHHPKNFFTIPPITKKLALRGVRSGASQLRQALRALALPNALRPRRRRFACFVLTSSATTSLHVRC
jgi:hypothetical protein